MRRFLSVIAAVSFMAMGLGIAGCGGSSGSGGGSGGGTVGAYAGTFYPLYNSGVKQWIEPTDSMPFDKVSAIYAAFAHAYPQGNGAIVDFEQGQTAQQARLQELEAAARGKNAEINVLISLGWGHDDWTFISDDIESGTNSFVPSVVQFLRTNDLDGFDIDNEEIGGKSGEISQADFDAVIANLRTALDAASAEDGKTYLLTITPAGNNDNTGGLQDTQVDAANAGKFDLINIQNYYNGSRNWGADFRKALKSINYPAGQIAAGIDTENCSPKFPSYAGLAGLFDWTMSADSACDNFKYTLKIANIVGYQGTP